MRTSSSPILRRSRRRSCTSRGGRCNTSKGELERERRLTENVARQGGRSVGRSGHEPHYWTERACSRRPDEVETWDRRLQSGDENRVSLIEPQRPEQVGREELVARDVDAKAGPEQDVIRMTRVAIVESKPYPPVLER